MWYYYWLPLFPLTNVFDRSPYLKNENIDMVWQHLCEANGMCHRPRTNWDLLDSITVVKIILNTFLAELTQKLSGQ